MCWLDYNKIADAVKNEIPYILEPPCKNCVWFTPRIRTNNKGVFDGVVICSASSMYHDFSCFESKTEPATDTGKK